MRKKFAIRTLVAAAALALFAAGCGAGAANNTAAGTGSAKGFAELAGANIHSDYEPLASPADAVRQADLIVRGTLVQVSDGVRIHYADQATTKRNANSYATFVIAVDKVVSGDAAKVTDGRVYLMVFKNSAATTKELSALNPGAKVVAVLDDITNWRPQPGAKVQRPAAIPAQAALYAPFNDGMWLQGAKDARMYGIDVELTELAPGWAGPRTVDQFTTGLDKAAHNN
jgi:hypothetical protein